MPNYLTMRNRRKRPNMSRKRNLMRTRIRSPTKMTKRMPNHLHPKMRMRNLRNQSRIKPPVRLPNLNQKRNPRESQRTRPINIGSNGVKDTQMNGERFITSERSSTEEKWSSSISDSSLRRS